MMRHEAFDLERWTLDQALIWISSRNPDWVVSDASWVEYRCAHLGTFNQETKRYEYEHEADPALHPLDAERQLLRALQTKQIDGLNGAALMDPACFDQADYLRRPDETLLACPHVPVAVLKTVVAGGGTHIQRVDPGDDRIAVRVPSAQVLATFPANSAGRESVEDIHDRKSSQPAATAPRPLKAELEAAYKGWVSKYVGLEPPSRKDDEAFLKERFPGNHITRDRVREIRAQLAPESWKRGGRRKLAE